MPKHHTYGSLYRDLYILPCLGSLDPQHLDRELPESSCCGDFLAGDAANGLGDDSGTLSRQNFQLTVRVSIVLICHFGPRPRVRTG